MERRSQTDGSVTNCALSDCLYEEVGSQRKKPLLGTIVPWRGHSSEAVVAVYPGKLSWRVADAGKMGLAHIL